MFRVQGVEGVYRDSGGLLYALVCMLWKELARLLRELPSRANEAAFLH